MAKKKTVTTIEEETTPDGVAEQHDQGVLAALSNQDEAVTIDPTTLDEEVVEEPVKEEVKAEPPLDKEALKAELKQEVTDDLKKEVAALKTEQTVDQKDEYDQFVEDYTNKHGQAPEWKQVASFLKDQAKQELKAELEAEVAAETKEAEDAKKTEQDRQQQLNTDLGKDWDEQLSDLERSGRIIPVKDPTDNRVQVITNDRGQEIERIPLEPGKRVRYELYKTMYLVSQERDKNGQKPLTNLKEVFYEHYDPKKSVAGADAPIAGVRKSVSQNSGQSFKYSDIHGPMDEVLPRLLEESR